MHPLIELFEQQAALLDLRKSAAGLDDAVCLLASWMYTAKDHLTDEDLAVLGELGGMLYREGVRKGRA
ncbi:MAG: hypothetical protein J7549_07760 [Variovorax sp.]|nr:hypothetical protein [Variovorax sp.]